jgi:hypothetical protein
LNPTMVSELFGSKHFGANYNLLNLAPASSSYALSVGLTATLYSHNLDVGCARQICTGTKCFQGSLFIMMGFTVLGMILSAVLALRSRAFYRTTLDTYKSAEV